MRLSIILGVIILVVVCWAIYNGLAPQEVQIDKGGFRIILREGYRPPRISITCPPEVKRTGPSYRTVFGGKANVAASGLPATLTVEYGDGRHYTTSTLEYFNSAYRYIYRTQGAFTVRARIVDSRGNSDEQSCGFTWHP
jgi:hypothetical protein